MRFNLARYCLDAAAKAAPDKVALIVVVSDAHAPIEQAECWSYTQLGNAVRRVAAVLR